MAKLSIADIKLKRSELILLVVTLLLVLVSGYIYFIEPMFSDYINMSKQIKSLQTAISKKSRYIEKNKGKAVCMKRFLRRHSMPVDIKNASNVVIKDLGEFAGKAGLVLKEVKPSYTEEQGSLVRIGVQLQVIGPLEKVLDFISKIEKAKGLFVIEKAVLSSNKKGACLQMVVSRIYFTRSNF